MQYIDLVSYVMVYIGYAYSQIGSVALHHNKGKTSKTIIYALRHISQGRMTNLYVIIFLLNLMI